jgi:hypothetical protein
MPFCKIPFLHGKKQMYMVGYRLAAALLAAIPLNPAT